MNCYFIYLISINVFSLALYFFDYFIYSKNKLIDALTTYVVIAGGGIGAMLAYIILDPIPQRYDKRKHRYVKEYRSRIYTLVWIGIYIIISLCLYGPNSQHVKSMLNSFYHSHTLICYYAAIINALSFVLYGIDKLKAILKKRRINETLLLLIAFIGGSIGSYLAMDVFNHKVSKDSFLVGIPMMIALHLVILLCLFLGVF